MLRSIHLFNLVRRPMSSSTPSSPDPFSATALCDAANRVRCIDHFQRIPAIRLGRAANNRPSAAVLVPLCIDPHTNQLSLLYTLRSAEIKSQPRQVSFPGGMRDPTDATDVACAIRETREEIGIDENQIEVSDLPLKRIHSTEQLNSRSGAKATQSAATRCPP